MIGKAPVPGMLDLAMGPKLMVCHDLKVKRREGRRRNSVREREREKREKKREEREKRGERDAMGCTGGSLYTIRSTPYSLYYPQVALSPPMVINCNYFILLPTSLHHGNRATTAMTVSPRVCGAPSRCPTQSRRGSASTRSCASNIHYIFSVAKYVH